MRKLMFSKLLSSVMVIAGFALFIFMGKHAFATPNATGGADNQTKEEPSNSVISAASLEKSVVFQLEGEPEDPAFWDMGGPSAKIAANANAVLSLDWIADGGSGNQRDDGVTTGTVSGQGTTIAVEVFATGVRTSLRGVILKFEFDASLLSYVKAENSAFPLAIPDASAGTNLAATTPAPLAASGFLARAEFETVADVTGREFSIGIESVTLAESSASQEELTTTREISFNATPSPDFDGDGTVGFSDFIAFAGGFGTSQGDSRYDVRFDLDGNGSVDFSDFLIFAGAFGSQVSPSGAGATVTIADANLRAVIADSLGKADNAPITRADMATLTGFSAPNKGIRNLTGLEYATNLRNLYLGGLVTIDDEWFNSNDISDLSPLSTLTNLTGLYLGLNSISDISALSNLTNLETLSLGVNRISDISTLSTVTNLTLLSILDNDITDISALSTLTNLTWLYLGMNSISDISPLVANSGLGNGDTVDLTDNPLSSTSRNTHIPTLQRRGVTVEFDSSNGNGGGGTTTPPSGNPDLVVESFLVPSPNTLTAGLSYQFGATVRNQGNASSASTTLRIYRSTDATVSTDDVEVGTHGVSALSAGDKSDEFFSLNAPSDAETYHFVACVDPVSGESNTGNNCSRPVTVIVRSAGSPDLIVESPSVNDNTLTTGQSFTFSATVRNQGNASAAATNLRYYRSSNATISADDTQVGTDGVSALSAGGTSAESISLNAPSDAATYYYGACVDNVSGESNADNNCSSGARVTVSGGKDVPSPVVRIPDANLRAVIADSLGKAGGAPITRAEMATLTHIEAPNKGIRSLAGLEHAIYLQGLTLNGAWVNNEFVNSNDVSDLTPISNLTNLNELGLEDNSITDISALSNLTSLYVLDLGRTSITDISALSNLTNLRLLYLGRTSITDISALSNLTSLSHLDLGETSITDISALSNLTNLTWLYLTGNGITDISTLSDLTNLGTLGLDDNSITDISALSNLTNLETLDLNNNSISDISALSNLTNLVDLNLWYNSISDISALANLTNLQRLSLGGTSISDISALSNLTNLTWLYLTGNSISDISALANLTNLDLLGLRDNSISDITPLVLNTGLGNGDTVYLKDNPLSSTSINTHIPTLQRRGVTVEFDSSTGDTNLGSCRVGLVVRPNQRCTVSGGAFINIGGGCYNYTPFGTGRFCAGSFNLNGLQGTRAGNDFRITAVP